ncbi:YkyA family protein [Anaerobacillus sp. CMMVII]|uniref:YkyA family protein n=1 Tax=Anaerobacillus sp. CMMVII TaxID=2755588 RepID=UPI0021B7CE68|nr:YkyA family protein [Anaerobacillus sp. CMMVII]MCT8139097.1 YkyA family protein [Anaerobacillus sp. CMMVII]
MFTFKKIRLGSILILFLVVVGCTKVNPAEEIYHHLEKAVSLEAPFEEQQEPLSKAENDEYELYDQILGLADLDEIKALATQAEEIAVTRKSMIEKERESIDEAYNEFLLITTILETIEDEDLKKAAEELVTIMENRYETYIELYNEYKFAIELDLELYNLIQKEDLTIDELETQHDKVNASYERLIVTKICLTSSQSNIMTSNEIFTSLQNLK